MFMGVGAELEEEQIRRARSIGTHGQTGSVQGYYSSDLLIDSLIRTSLGRDS